MAKSLLSVNQKKFLDFFSEEKSLYSLFYLTGGTALSEFYLQHRYSEDLDFFSEKEFDIKDITTLIESKKDSFGKPRLEYTQSFNRNIYQLIYPRGESLKVEFTYFPFKRIDTTHKAKNISVDSLLDIAVNKLFTIYQNPRGRDYFDLYFIKEKRGFASINELVRLARIKFDVAIDFLQLGTYMLKVDKFLDDPILKITVDNQQIKDFFSREAKKFKKKIIKSD